MRAGAPLSVAAAGLLSALSAPLSAQAILDIAVDLPAGPLGLAAEALARQSGTNIVIGDRRLWNRPVPRLRARMTEASAIRRLAALAAVRAVRIEGVGWRLESRPPAAAARTRSPPPPSMPDAEPDDLVVIGSKRAAFAQNFATVVERLADLDTGQTAGSQAIVLASTIVSSTYRGSGRDKLFVRGIADSATAANAQAVTGIYFGDLRLNHTASDPDLQLHDMESVEVLQGPQGTLYGSGSLAGVIRLNPRRPRTDRWEAAGGTGLSWTSAGAPGADADAMVNLPLDGRTALRMVGYARQDGGYVDRPAIGRDRNRVRIAGGRANLRRLIGSDWTLDAVAIGQAARGRDGPASTRGAGDFVNQGLVAEPFAADFHALHLVAAGRIGPLDLTTSLGVARQSLRERADATSIPSIGGPLDTDRRTVLMLHETRLSHRGTEGSGWVIGLSYAGSDEVRSSREMRDGNRIGQRAETDVRDAALFGEGAFRPWRPLLLGAGLRGTLVGSRARLISEGVPGAAGFPAITRTQGWLAPSLSAMLTLSDRLRIFARHQQGYRPGALVPASGDQVVALDSDRLHALELGGRIDGSRATVELSIARSRWRDIQSDYVDGGGPAFTANIGDGRILSVNARATWRPVDGLVLDGAVTLNDSRIASPLTGPVVLPDEGPQSPDAPAASLVALPAIGRVPYVADAIGRIAIRYGRDLGRDGRVTVDGWSRYEGRSAATVGAIETGSQGPFATTGLAVAWQPDPAGQAPSVHLSADNLFDARGSRFTSGPSIETASQLVAQQRPLTVRIGLFWERRRNR